MKSGTDTQSPDDVVVLLGWRSTRQHWKCRWTFMQNETVRVTCNCACHNQTDPKAVAA